VTDLTPQKPQGLDRRALLRNGLLVGLGAAAVTVAAPNLAGIARASATVPVEAPNGNIMEFTVQPGWLWCKNCQGLFYPYGDPPYPWCVSGKDGIFHDAGSNWNYQVPFGTPPSGGAAYLQGGWEYCDNCNGLFAYNTGFGRCADGGEHLNNLTGTYPYYLPNQNGWRGGPMQDAWSWCNQCSLLFFGPNVANSACPYNYGKHVRGTWNYWVPSPSA
jgi:hypothetical protein